MKVFLAGPLFTAAERAFNRRLREQLEHFGHGVWLAQDHEPPSRDARDIFLADVAGLESSEVVVANMDGPDPDSGTCWECGYAYNKKKPIIVYRTDLRRAGDAENSPYNLMLSASADIVVDCSKDYDNEQEIAAKINQALQSIQNQSNSRSGRGPSS